MTDQIPCLAWTLGYPEILLILVVLLLLFGRRLPEFARSVGKSLTEFKKGMREAKDEIEKSVDTDELDLNNKD